MAETPSTKLIVLGLPWAANEDQLWSYFSQFGAVNGAEIIREKPSGKSRGFGFVDFNEASSAEAALRPSHNIGGRHCDVKFAVPKGDRPFMKTRRIFVARIPLHVTEKEFHEYFGQFGKMEDGYMPKDHTHQNFRGIGFVTYADSTAVGKVMAVKHRLGDADIVVDCATPKDTQAQESGPVISQLETHDKSEDHHCPSPAGNVNDYGQQQGSLSRDVSSTQLTAEDSPVRITQFENQQRLFQILREQREYIATNQDRGDALNISHGPVCLSAVSLPSNLLPVSTMEQASSDLSTVMSSFSHGFDVLKHSLQGLPLYSGIQVDPEQSVSRELETGAGLSQSDIAPIPIGAITRGGQHVTHRRPQSVHSITSSQSGDPAKVIEARNGPRLFVGKLPKGTNQQDLRNHFSKFGFVMDVFIPRAKNNKKEHRGFGFVTYETEAAIQRVVAHGTHRIRDAVVAVDVAVPEEPGNVSHNQHHHFHLQSRADQAVGIGCSQGLRDSHSGNLSQLQTGAYRPY